MFIQKNITKFKAWTLRHLDVKKLCQEFYKNAEKLTKIMKNCKKLIKIVQTSVEKGFQFFKWNLRYKELCLQDRKFRKLVKCVEFVKSLRKFLLKPMKVFKTSQIVQITTKLQENIQEWWMNFIVIKLNLSSNHLLFHNNNSLYISSLKFCESQFHFRIKFCMNFSIKNKF